MPSIAQYKPICYPYCCECPLDPQHRLAESVETQQQRILDYYHQELESHCDWTGWFVDPARVLRLNFTHREAGQAILQRARRGDVVVVSRLRCVFRTVKDLSLISRLLAKAGIQLYVVQDNLELTEASAWKLLEAVCQVTSFVGHCAVTKQPHYQHIYSRHLFDVTNRKGKRHYYFSEVKFRRLQWAFDLFRRGAHKQSIANELNRASVTTPGGGPWKIYTVDKAFQIYRRYMKILDQVRRGLLLEEHLSPHLWRPIAFQLEQERLDARQRRLTRAARLDSAESGDTPPHSFPSHQAVDTSPDESPVHLRILSPS
jgi:hypothetical protein